MSGILCTSGNQTRKSTRWNLHKRTPTCTTVCYNLITVRTSFFWWISQTSCVAKLSLSTLWNSAWKNDLCHWPNIIIVAFSHQKKLVNQEGGNFFVSPKKILSCCEMYEEESRFIYEPGKTHLFAKTRENSENSGKVKIFCFN